MNIDRLKTLVSAELGTPVASELFRHEHLSLVVGLLMDDERRVVAKARPDDPRHEACAEVQRRLFDAGFPCARLILGPLSVRGISIVVEEYLESSQDDQRGLAPSPAASAQAIHRLMSTAPLVDEVPDLGSPPAWLAWNHTEPGTWPMPDDGSEDLNTVDSPNWLTDAAQHVRHVLRSVTARPVVGHGDWEAQNVFWEGGELAVVHDWDSLVALPEAALVGAAGVCSQCLAVNQAGQRSRIPRSSWQHIDACVNTTQTAHPHR